MNQFKEAKSQQRMILLEWTNKNRNYEILLVNMNLNKDYINRIIYKVGQTELREPSKLSL